MSYESNLQGSAVKTAVSAIPVIGSILAGLLPADIGNDWTTANAIWATWLTKQYQTRISRQATRTRARWVARAALRRGVF